VTRPPHLEVGYIARAHGLKGEVAVCTHDPESNVLGEVERVWLVPLSGAPRAHRVASRRRGTREWLLRLSEVGGRDASAALRGAKVAVFREDLPPPCEAQGPRVSSFRETWWDWKP
jgi:16S rRNA processing protein RimM